MKEYGFGKLLNEDQIYKMHQNYQDFLEHKHVPSTERLEVIDNIILGKVHAFFNVQSPVTKTFSNALVLVDNYEQGLEEINHLETLFQYRGSICNTELNKYTNSEVGSFWCLQITNNHPHLQPKAYYVYYIKRSKMLAFSKQSGHFIKLDQIYWATPFRQQDMQHVHLFSTPEVELYYSKEDSHA